jgi:hypothetical protein
VRVPSVTFASKCPLDKTLCSVPWRPAALHHVESVAKRRTFPCGTWYNVGHVQKLGGVFSLLCNSSCDEVEKGNVTKGRLLVEEAISAAKIRKCPNCKKAFIKSDGCNKITCGCGTKSCYIWYVVVGSWCSGKMVNCIPLTRFLLCWTVKRRSRITPTFARPHIARTNTIAKNAPCTPRPKRTMRWPCGRRGMPPCKKSRNWECPSLRPRAAVVLWRQRRQTEQLRHHRLTWKVS